MLGPKIVVAAVLLVAMVTECSSAIIAGLLLDVSNENQYN